MDGELSGFDLETSEKLSPALTCVFPVSSVIPSGSVRVNFVLYVDGAVSDSLPVCHC
jgi:predicted patatin/cPLA2 family phospholipase